MAALTLRGTRMDARKAAAGHIVLIVDDEPLQRMTVADMLYDAGFWTVEAAGRRPGAAHAGKPR